MTPADVPSGPILVDADVASFVGWQRGPFREFEPFLVGRVVAISFATAGELYMGAEKAAWGAKRRGELDLIIRRYAVLVPNEAVTRKFGEVYAKFSDSLGRSGQNDAWTAACALAQDSPIPIVTNNRKHFEAIARLFPDLLVVHPDI